MAMQVYPTVEPVLAENVTIRFKADGGMVFVDTETQQETDRLELFIKNRPADDETRRNDNMNDINYKKIEVEMIDMALPVDIVGVDNSYDGGQVVGAPIATSEMTNNWKEVQEYVKKTLILTTGVGNFEAYRNIMSSSELSNINFKITKNRDDKWVLELVESRSNSDFKYFNHFVKMLDNDFEITTNTDGFVSGVVIAEKRLSNYDYKEHKQLDLDLIFRIQVVAEVQLIIANTK